MGDKTQGGGVKKNFGKKNEKRLVGRSKERKEVQKDRITYVDKSTPRKL
jgi:hypothetical protein